MSPKCRIARDAGTPQPALQRARERAAEAREVRVADDADPGHAFERTRDGFVVERGAELRAGEGERVDQVGERAAEPEPARAAASRAMSRCRSRSSTASTCCV